MVADVTLRYLTMAESRTGERSSQPEFEAFYLRTSRLLHGYLCRLSRDPATADEVLQEAYVRLINAPDMEEQVRKAYLYRTATNLLRDRWRKQKRERKYWQTENFSEAVYQDLDMPLDVSSVFENHECGRLKESVGLRVRNSSSVIRTRSREAPTIRLIKVRRLLATRE